MLPTTTWFELAIENGEAAVDPSSQRMAVGAGPGLSTVGAGKELRRVQTGRVQNYALGIAVGLIVMAGSFLVLAAR